MTDLARDRDSVSSGDSPILEPGRNYWKREHASRLATLVDAADYFSAFAAACRAAEHQILILGWDFDRRVRLHRGNPAGGLPDGLGDFLVSLLEQKPNLHIYLLLWDFNIIYATEREFLPALKLRLLTPSRFHFRLDDNHPKGGSHHQKIVVVDDRVAFVGGIDLSRWRWDTPEHMPDDPRRTDPDGKPYPPFHDLMMLVEGAVAGRLGELARERWRRSGGGSIKPPIEARHDIWPNGVAEYLAGADIAIARTEPDYRGRNAVNEVEHLYIDAIAAARKTIYIENQYFTAYALANALAERLAEEHGPEVILVLPEQTGGWLEQMTMDVVRGRIVSRLHDADRHDRLRIYFPYQPGLGDACISVHAKLMIVDDRLLRIGSSNTSNRSMGLDTECDLALESRQPDDQIARYIDGLRSRLLAEHLACKQDDVTRALQQQGSTIRAIESLRSEQRSLRPLDCTVPPEFDEKVPDSYLIDPPEPFSAEYFVEAYVPESRKSQSRRRLLLFASIVVTLLALAAAWRWTALQEFLSPERIELYFTSITSLEGRAVVAIGGFIIASLLMVPLTLLAVVGGVVFEGWQAFVYVLAGAMGSAAIGFFSGRFLGRGLLKHLSGSRIEQLSKRLAKRGTFAVAILRLVPVAPFAIFNLVAGSSHLGAWQFLAGSLIGLTPGLGAITLFSNSLWEALTAPSLANIAIVVVFGVILIFIAWLAKRWLRTS